MELPNRAICHIDMDAFYAQVEVSLDPARLAGRPLAVVQYDGSMDGSDQARGISNDRILKHSSQNSIIALSYGAKARGVRRHMRASEAREVCPEIVLVQVPASHGKADISIYRNASQRVLGVLMAAADGACERASVDEVYVDLTDAAQRLLDDHADAEGGLGDAPAVPQPPSFASMFVSSLETGEGLPEQGAGGLPRSRSGGPSRPEAGERSQPRGCPDALHGADAREEGFGGHVEGGDVTAAPGDSLNLDPSRFARDALPCSDPPSPLAMVDGLCDDELLGEGLAGESFAWNTGPGRRGLEADAVSASLERARGGFAAGAPPIAPKERFVAASGWFARPREEWLPGEALLAAAAVLASRIRRDVWEKLGFTCSTGVGPTKLLAKVASATHKPGGQTIVTAVAAADALAPMPMRSLRGLGGKMGRYLAEQTGIETVGDLARLSASRLAALVGEKEAGRLLALAVGVDHSAVVNRRIVRDISWGKSFRGRAALRQRGEVALWLRRLSAGLSERLREDAAANPRVASSLTLSWSLRRLGEYDRQGGFTSRSSPLGRHDADAILAVAQDLADRALPWGSIGREVSIGGIYLKAGRFLDTGGSASIRSFFAAKTAADGSGTAGGGSASGEERTKGAGCYNVEGVDRETLGDNEGIVDRACHDDNEGREDDAGGSIAGSCDRGRGWDETKSMSMCEVTGRVQRTSSKSRDGTRGDGEERPGRQQDEQGGREPSCGSACAPGPQASPSRHLGCSGEILRYVVKGSCASNEEDGDASNAGPPAWGSVDGEGGSLVVHRRHLARPGSLDAFVRGDFGARRSDAEPTRHGSVAGTSDASHPSPPPPTERAESSARRTVDPPPTGVDAETWAALPREIRAELITQAKFAAVDARRRAGGGPASRRPEKKKQRRKGTAKTPFDP